MGTLRLLWCIPWHGSLIGAYHGAYPVSTREGERERDIASEHTLLLVYILAHTPARFSLQQQLDRCISWCIPCQIEGETERSYHVAYTGVHLCAYPGTVRLTAQIVLAHTGGHTMKEREGERERKRERDSEERGREMREIDRMSQQVMHTSLFS